MKIKNLFSMLAMAGMLFATSCSQDEAISGASAGDYVNATFTISTPDGIGTRGAIGDGTNADKVACTVYDKAGKEMGLYQIVDVTTNEEGKRVASYNIRLAKGQNYRVAFFAYNSTANAYDVKNLKSVKILPNQACNVEGRDAFTNYIDIKAEDLTNKSNIEETVILKRPFAQLNLGIDDAEFEAAEMAGVVVTNSKIVVTDVWNAFSAYDNTVADDATLAPMTFALNGIPTEKLDVNGNKYTYLALNYILVGDQKVESSLTDVEFIWKTADGKTNEPTTHFINVPVQRNYRTNIIGRLLTTPADFNIVIDAEFEKDYIVDINSAVTKTVTTVDDLVAAVNNASEGQTIIKIANELSSSTSIELDQQKKAQVFIDGQDNVLDLKIIIDGNNNWTGSEEMTIQNVQFKYTGSEKEIIAIATDDASTGNSYAHNINIKNCTFAGSNETTAIRANQAFDLNIYKCIANDLHSFSQISSTVGATIDQVTSNCVRGMHVDARNCVISNSTITATGEDKYGIRHDVGNANDGLKILNCSVSASFPVVVRNTQHKSTVENYTLTFEGNNTLTPASGAYHVAIAQEEYDKIGKELSVLNGNVEVTGADASWTIFK